MLEIEIKDVILIFLFHDSFQKCCSLNEKLSKLIICSKVPAIYYKKSK